MPASDEVKGNIDRDNKYCICSSVLLYFKSMKMQNRCKVVNIYSLCAKLGGRRTPQRPSVEGGPTTTLEGRRTWYFTDQMKLNWGLKHEKEAPTMSLPMTSCPTTTLEGRSPRPTPTFKRRRPDPRLQVQTGIMSRTPPPHTYWWSNVCRIPIKSHTKLIKLHAI